MKKNVLIITLLGALSILSLTGYAQATANHTLTMGIPEVCLLTTPAGAISLELTTTVPGAPISGGLGSGYSQISSIVSAAELRTITASITGVPTGTSLAVSTVVPTNGNQAGVIGTGTSDIELVNAAAAVTLVTGIGSCYTGTAATDGYKLDYAWNAGASGDYGSIVATVGSTATVVLTITNQ